MAPGMKSGQALDGHYPREELFQPAEATACCTIGARGRSVSQAGNPFIAIDLEQGDQGFLAAPRTTNVTGHTKEIYFIKLVIVLSMWASKVWENLVSFAFGSVGMLSANLIGRSRCWNTPPLICESYGQDVPGDLAQRILQSVFGGLVPLCFTFLHDACKVDCPMYIKLAAFTGLGVVTGFTYLGLISKKRANAAVRVAASTSIAVVTVAAVWQVQNVYARCIIGVSGTMATLVTAAINWSAGDALPVSLQDISTPEPSLQDINNHDPSLQDISTPEPSLQDVSTPDPSLQDVSTPDPSLQDTGTPDPSQRAGEN